MTRIPPSERNRQIAEAYASADASDSWLHDLGGALHDLGGHIPPVGVGGIAIRGAMGGVDAFRSLIGGGGADDAIVAAATGAFGQPQETARSALSAGLDATSRGAKDVAGKAADVATSVVETTKTGFDKVVDKVAEVAPDVAGYFGDTFRIVILAALAIAGIIVLIKVA